MEHSLLFLEQKPAASERLFYSLRSILLVENKFTKKAQVERR